MNQQPPPAETWLAKHDARYTTSRTAWPHITTTGTYRTPRHEIPIGNTNDLEQAVTNGGTFTEHGAIGQHACHQCHAPYTPRTTDHHYCSPNCRHQARRTYMRTYMRQRRQKKAPVRALPLLGG